MHGNMIENTLIASVAVSALAIAAGMVGWSVMRCAESSGPVAAGICAAVDWVLAVLISCFLKHRSR